MFEIRRDESGLIVLCGRLDAAQAAKAEAVLAALTTPSTVDFGALEYVSSAGLAVLLKAQKRLVANSGRGLRLVNMNRHIHEIFRYAGFDQIFEIDAHSP